ncbi:DNA-binding NarL/FixJ family response regulator [Dyadobacter jejuensis]|uniref:DNA-binding NarL/FixJ family response regulator n=1 Tax=Dyadobacter jejuensis TaxID=1082580 RepID=A0A316ANX6_9BACT|nr:response regulator transcription factor [Dyadobacter jejuensis]PWJ58844.1 DNA-binding NarL/FixJ family response regulator [Dyadobacter jejuensis]
MTQPNKARIILVDDHQIVLDSLSILLSSFENLEIVSVFTNGMKALQYLKEHPVDLVICDFRMPIINGIDLCAQARQQIPDLKILMLTMVEEPQQIRSAIKMGINGYILKMADTEELIYAINTILAGKRYFSDEVVIELAIYKDGSQSTPGGFANLTIREIEVLRLVAKELSTNQIAEKLYISVPTVETHRRNLMQKIGAKSVVGMVLFAVKNELID